MDDPPTGGRQLRETAVLLIEMLEALQPDRPQNREPRWFVVDAFVAMMFIWITVESLRSFAYVAEYGPIEGFGWIIAISPTMLLFFRRVAPLAAMVIAVALYMLASWLQGDSNAPLAIPLFAYSVGMTRPIRTSGWLVGGAAAVMSTSVFYGPGDPLPLSVPVVVMLFGIGWAVAVSVRGSQTRADSLAVEAEALRAESSAVAMRAVADERARIARELHDAVGHAVNVIVMHAGAARLATDDTRAAATLRKIEQVGRSALTDLDHMLGLLHETDGDGVPLQPTRTTKDIARLVDGMKAGGADIHLHNSCDSSLDDAISGSAGAAAYRIVQEALTNAVKHAGEARTDVTVSAIDGLLEIVVVDDGLGAAAPGTTRGGGRGIAGMAERAKVLGGQLTAEPLAAGGFQVRALIPLTQTPATAADRAAR